MQNEFDMEQLDELTGGDKEILKELLESFFECAHNCIEGLEKSLSTDPDSWKEHAHALKGVALNFGAPKLADLSKTAEHLPIGDTEKKQEMIKELLATYKNLKTYCKSL